MLATADVAPSIDEDMKIAAATNKERNIHMYKAFIFKFYPPLYHFVFCYAVQTTIRI